jgi:hypothetical protein
MMPPEPANDREPIEEPGFARADRILSEPTPLRSSYLLPIRASSWRPIVSASMTWVTAATFAQ